MFTRCTDKKGVRVKNLFQRVLGRSLPAAADFKQVAFRRREVQKRVAVGVNKLVDLALRPAKNTLCLSVMNTTL